MASIRRTLSPINQERSSFHQNGVTPSPLSISSPSHKLPQPPPFSSRFFLGFRIFLTGVLHLPEKHSRRAQHKSWKRPFYRCLLFFFVGFLLGVLLFGHNNNVRTHDMSFEIKPESIRAQEEEIRAEDSILKPNDDIKNADDVEAKFDVVLTEKFDYKPRKLLIVVTPTYNNRALQAYYLNRLGQVLKLVNPPVLWVVVEMEAQSQETAGFLRNTGLMYRHLVCKKNVTDIKDWGVHQRNTALEHIELHRLDGIVYFADEDNIYSLELFERIRDISRFGTWPVALLAQSKNKAILEGPVCNESQVAGWHTNEKSKGIRRFHVDMSGFAFNSTILWDPKRWKRPFLNSIRQLDTVKEGFQETTFMEQVIAEESDMESVPHGCGKIMNWHMHLAARGVEYPRGWLLQKNLDAVLSVD